jgi:NlpC/P60 family
MATATAVIQAAMTQIGIPYQWGGENPNHGFDCSGLVQWAFQQAGISLPRTSEEQYTATARVPAAQARPGDLAFMEFGAQGQQGPGHVGIYLGAGQFLEAPETGQKIKIAPLPSGVQFGRVSGLSLNAGSNGMGTATTASASGTVATSASSPGTGCSSSGGVLGFGTGCQLKALTGGLCVGMGALVMVSGALLIATYGLKETGAGKAVTRSALALTPMGRAAKLIT